MCVWVMILMWSVVGGGKVKVACGLGCGGEAVVRGGLW